ncbi:MAG: hypothetical protein KA229_14180 [Chitinophagaceae bacterium]|nr:hypothetical protein [Chitinophagaceae bacterium]
MKKMGLIVSGLLMTVLSFGQSYEASIQYDKKKQQAIAIDFVFQPQAVENAIVQKLAKMGYKPKEEKGILNRDKGFLVFKNIFITDIMSDRMDYLIKVERKSRKEADESIMYLVMLKDDKNAMGMMDAGDVGRAKSFLNNLLPEVEAADLELQIIAQQEVVAKAEKKLRDLKEEQTSLERKIADNKSGQESTQKDIESQKQALGVLEGKRRTSN